MKFIILSFLIAISVAHAETPTKERDVLWECAYETGEPHSVRNQTYSEYSDWVFQVYPTRSAGVFLVKEGLRDMNAGATFVFVREWTVKEIKPGVYQSQRDPSVTFTVTSDLKGYSPVEYKGAEYRCEKRPWE